MPPFRACFQLPNFGHPLMLLEKGDIARWVPADLSPAFSEDRILQNAYWFMQPVSCGS
jgi:hypothetical protein